MLSVEDRAYACAIGRAGTRGADNKREGDGATPLGRWPLRGALLRRDGGFHPPTTIPWRWIRDGDGWCDDPASSQYNRPVFLPSNGRAERLLRDDGVYDVILVLGHNDRPPLAPRGSAIFVHLQGLGDTEGCVAIDRHAMSTLLDKINADTIVEIC